MTDERLVVLGIILVGASGIPGLVFGRWSALGQWLATAQAVTGNLLGLFAAVGSFLSGRSQPLVLPWPVPGGEFSVALDTLSVIFLIPIFLISTLGSLYGMEYWKQSEHPDNGRKLRFFYGTVTAGMALLVVARNSILFLVGWEVMALSAFFLVSTEDDQKDVREAGWVYMIATHVATLILFGLFGVLRGQVGSFQIVPLADGSVSPEIATALFVLALVGFGFKAGIMPLHVWLPGAHANAPSHVSALMSGVLIKMGIYGIVRVTSMLPHPPVWWGGLLLGLGMVSGILGIAFAIGQEDFKRLLAYSSIENIGIIFIGLGLGLLGRALGRPDWVVLGMAGALLHVWNHGLFKSLLFFNAGAILHATHTRRTDLLGGLSKSMPGTSALFLVGSLSVCALPPFNGFVSELFLYLGLFRTLGIGAGRSFASAAYAAPALGLIGALALACFVKAYGSIFLGSGRSPHTANAHDPGGMMLVPMAVQAAGCLTIGLAPGLAAPVLDRAIREWAPEMASGAPGLATLAPLASISQMGLLLLGVIVAGGLLLRGRLRANNIGQTVTWDCGYAAPASTMQYTSSSFAEMLVGLFRWVLRPRTETPIVEGIFPGRSEFSSEVPDTVLDRGIVPAFQATSRLFFWLRIIQQGHIQLYLLYILVAVIALMLWR